MTKNTEIIAAENTNEFVVAGNENFINTFDLSSNKGKMATINAVNNSEPLANHMNEALKICDCVTMPGIRRGRNGMPDTPCINSHLIDVDGISYFSQSDGVARAIQMFASCWDDFGKNSTEEGYLELVCIAKPLPNGNTLKTLVFASELA